MRGCQVWRGVSFDFRLFYHLLVSFPRSKKPDPIEIAWWCYKGYLGGSSSSAHRRFLMCICSVYVRTCVFSLSPLFLSPSLPLSLPPSLFSLPPLRWYEVASADRWSGLLNKKYTMYTKIVTISICNWPFKKFKSRSSIHIFKRYLKYIHVSWNFFQMCLRMA